MRGCGVYSAGLRWDPVGGFYEHGTEPSGSVKVGNFLTS